MSEKTLVWMIWGCRLAEWGLYAFLTGCVLMAGIWLGADSVRSEAIKAGVGVWVIDAETGDRGFEFRKPVETSE